MFLMASISNSSIFSLCSFSIIWRIISKFVHLFESEVSVSYFLSDEKKTEEEILEKWLGKLFVEITAEY